LSTELIVSFPHDLRHSPSLLIVLRVDTGGSLALSLHSSYESSELSQLSSHNGSTTLSLMIVGQLVPHCPAS